MKTLQPPEAGRYLKGDETIRQDGLDQSWLGAICYLDEIVEACKDTTVLIHFPDRSPPDFTHR